MVSSLMSCIVELCPFCFRLFFIIRVVIFFILFFTRYRLTLLTLDHNVRAMLPGKCFAASTVTIRDYMLYSVFTVVRAPVLVVVCLI